MNNDRKKRTVLLYLFAFQLSFALSSGMFSIILPELINQYSLNIQQASLFSTLTGVGILGANLFTGFAADKLNKNRMLGYLLLLVGIFQICIGNTPPFLIILLSFCLLYGVSNTMDKVCSAYLSDLYGSERLKYLSYLHAFFGLGSMLGPQFIHVVLLSGLKWNFAYLFSGILFMMFALLFKVTMKKRGVPETEVQKSIHQKGSFTWKKMLKQPDMLVFSFVSFMYAGYILFSTWLPTYLINVDSKSFSLEYCTILISISSVGMIVSRLVNSFISKYIKPVNQIILNSTITAFFIAIALLCQNVTIWTISAFLIGFFTGAIYTLQFAMVCELFPGSSASAVGIVGLFSAVGSILFNMIAGNMASLAGYQITIYIPIFSLIVISITLSIYQHKKAAMAPKKHGRKESKNKLEY